MAEIVITGGTSFLGSHLIKKLVQEQHTIYAIVRPNSNHAKRVIRDPRCKMIYADVKDTLQWKKGIPGADVFLHLAWDGSGMQGRADAKRQKGNIKMSLDCLKAAAELGAKRFIFFGSQAEYGPQEEPVDESSPCNPVTAYGKAKLEFGEQARVLSRELDIEYMHLRIFSVYGPGDHPWTLVNSCIDAFMQGRDVRLSDCVQPWNFLHVADCADAVKKLFGCTMNEKNLTVNISGDETKPLREYVDTIWRLTGNQGRPLYGAREGQLERPYGILPKNEKLHCLVEWSQGISFEEGIQGMISNCLQIGITHVGNPASFQQDL